MSSSAPAPDIAIVQLDPSTLHALAQGDAAAAVRTSPVPLSAWLLGPECRSTWHRRSEQLRNEPADQPWVTGVIWDDEHARAVGRAGFHARPDVHGMVEIGYSVDPLWRRRGYARAAVQALLTRAARDPGVRVVRASVAPTNTASLRLISQFGFQRVGEQWDDDDGLEWVHEVAVTDAVGSGATR